MVFFYRPMQKGDLSRLIVIYLLLLIGSSLKRWGKQFSLGTERWNGLDGLVLTVPLFGQENARN